ncbi:MAG TPA: hypothetical protein VIF61_09550 [Methylocystis sp.]|jgi:hypothetical protein
MAALSSFESIHPLRKADFPEASDVLTLTLRRLLYAGLAHQKIKRAAFLLCISVVSPRDCPRRFGGRFLRALVKSINISRGKENGRRELNM